MTKLNPRLLDALEEVSRYRGGDAPFWWRQASMQKLAAMGLVEAWDPDPRSRSTKKAHRITSAGRAALAKADEGSGDA